MLIDLNVGSLAPISWCGEEVLTFDEVALCVPLLFRVDRANAGLLLVAGVAQETRVSLQRLMRHQKSRDRPNSQGARSYCQWH